MGSSYVELCLAAYNVSMHLNFNLYMLCAHAQSLQSCLTLCDSMDHSLPDSSVRGILQARTQVWVVMPSSRGSSQPRDQAHISCSAGRFLTYMLSSVTLLCSAWDLCLCTVVCNMSLGNFISHTTCFPAVGDHSPMPSIIECLFLFVFFLLLSNCSWLRLHLNISLDYRRSTSLVHKF